MSLLVGLSLGPSLADRKSKVVPMKTRAATIVLAVLIFGSVIATRSSGPDSTLNRFTLGRSAGAAAAVRKMSQTVTLGSHWYGPELTMRDLKGRVVLIEDWGYK